jgi:glycosyltransferase involved in cell wall biosynthesis
LERGTEAGEGSGGWKIAAVVPCYRSSRQILDVLAGITPSVFLIVVVDDACPEQTGAFVEQHCTDGRVTVVRNLVNKGVGGSVMAGYAVALARGADIVVKLDSDGQMDPAMLPALVEPILRGHADYVKGNRFFNIEDVQSMPAVRVLGNACLSFLTKLSSGYWHIFDPTNGYTAIHRVALMRLPLTKIDERFFFESDMLFRLNLADAVVLDFPMVAKYGDEQSNLRVRNVIWPFLAKNIRNFAKRIFYSYFLRAMSIGSLELLLGVLLLGFGTLFGAVHWMDSVISGVPATAGTVMVASLPIIVGIQMLLGFFAYDFQAVPRTPLQLLHSHSERSRLLRA